MARQKQSYILTADLGNTTLTMGLYRKGKISHRVSLPHAGLRANFLREALAGLVGSATVEGVAFASVAPSLDGRFEKCLRGAAKAPFLRVDHRCDFGMKISYPKPETLGVDRLLNAAWVAHRYGAPAMVCDMGTATTVDVLLPSRGFVGGVILPGPALMLDYLADRTGKLPAIKLSGSVKRSCGRSTEEAMRIGARRGFNGMIREVVESMQAEHSSMSFRLVVGGGYSRAVHLLPEMHPVIELNMTLGGLGLVFELMHPGTEKLKNKINGKGS
ncbi:MAG: type III pantothenate kinase [Kiritimatiellae bacterium]|nr:type III pantothenate kinase [Kiritimatiellia bacterium]